MSKQITLLGSINGETLYTAADVEQLLNTQRTELLHGQTFTGRPDTQIYLSDENVLKIHGEIRLDMRSAQRWATQALEKERLYGVHHPHKTWFVAIDAEDNQPLIGNLCPRLMPLHDLLNSSTTTLEQRFAYFKQLFFLYFDLAKRTDKRLDEGLSNFGSAPDGTLYYLDDDIYTWDKFMSCAHMLGVYFRGSQWLDVAAAAQLGQIVHNTIIEVYQDKQYLMVLAEQLNEIFIPNPQQRAALDKFIEVLRGFVQQTGVNHLNQTRYIALLADIHANLPALKAVLAFLRMQNIKQGVVLGDTVGYGPHPSECIELIQDTEFSIVKGNHDHALATHSFQKGFSSTAAWVLDWSDSRVSAAQKNWLADLPPVLHNDNWLALHGAPVDPTFFNAYVYEMTYHDNLDNLQRKGISFCFHGHTHQPGIYARRDSIMDSFYDDTVVSLARFNHGLICPGSVGQPRNGVAGAQFAIYDQQDKTIHYHNLMYNLDEVLGLMEAEQFPDPLINVLQGRL